MTMKKELYGFMIGLSLVSCGFFVGKGVDSLSIPVFQLDYLGQKEAQMFNYGLEKEKVREAAQAIYDGMHKQNDGVLEGYSFNSVSDAKRVLLYLNFQILNGKTSPLRIYKDNGKYTIGWENADRVLYEDAKGTEFIDKVWKDIAGKVSEFATEKEKAAFLARYICDEIILGYDFDENGNVAEDATRSIYDLSVSDDNKAVCIVYATLFDRLCERAGIESEVVIGVKGAESQESHSWNKVIVDGRETYYDLTNYAQVRSENFLDMEDSGFYEMAEYREFEDYEFGYRAAINSVDKER